MLKAEKYNAVKHFLVLSGITCVDLSMDKG